MSDRLPCGKEWCTALVQYCEPVFKVCQSCSDLCSRISTNNQEKIRYSCLKHCKEYFYSYIEPTTTTTTTATTLINVQGSTGNDDSSFNNTVIFTVLGVLIALVLIAILIYKHTTKNKNNKKQNVVVNGNHGNVPLDTIVVNGNHGNVPLDTVVVSSKQCRQAGTDKQTFQQVLNDVDFKGDQGNVTDLGMLEMTDLDSSDHRDRDNGSRQNGHNGDPREEIEECQRLLHPVDVHRAEDGNSHGSEGLHPVDVHRAEDGNRHGSEGLIVIQPVDNDNTAVKVLSPSGNTDINPAFYQKQKVVQTNQGDVTSDYYSRNGQVVVSPTTND